MKNKFGKFIAAIICVCILICMLSGCTGSTSESTSTPAPTPTLSPEEMLEIKNKIWYSADDDVFYHFFDDGTMFVELVANNEYGKGTYDWNGVSGSLSVLGLTIDIVYEDSVLALSDGEYDYVLEEDGDIEETAFDGDISNTGWLLDTYRYNFDEDSMHVYDGTYAYYATYEWDNGMGSMSIDGDKMDLIIYNGKLLISSDGEFFYDLIKTDHEDPASFYGTGAESQLKGEWQHSDDENSALVFDGVENVSVSKSGAAKTEYAYSFDGANLAILGDDGSLIDTGYIDIEGNIVINGRDGGFARQEE